MKNFKLVTLIIALGVSSLTFALPTNDGPKAELHNQIVEILNKADLEFVANDLNAEVVFTLNKNAELVVVSVSSDDAAMDGFIKSQLNYKKVKVSSFKEGKIYKVPVTILKI